MSDDKAVDEYLANVPADRQEVVNTVHQTIMKAIPELKPHIIAGMGRPMIAYGTYHYKSKSGREGDWVLVLLANQKSYVSTHVCAVGEDGKYLAEANADRLGKVTTGRSCIQFKKLEDINLDVLSELCKEAVRLGGVGSFAL